tara:strand:+ start:71 stop:553 length:483 start_codon:yes stop_codon:yes gene_type:complete
MKAMDFTKYNFTRRANETEKHRINFLKVWRKKFLKNFYLAAYITHEELHWTRIKETAKILGCSAGHLQRLVQNKDLVEGEHWKWDTKNGRKINVRLFNLTKILARHPPEYGNLPVQKFIDQHINELAGCLEINREEASEEDLKDLMYKINFLLNWFASFD